MSKMPASKHRIVCTQCGKKFMGDIHWHHGTGLCSRRCRILRARVRRAKYDKTEKGIANERKWRLNPRKKIIDLKARSTPYAKRLAVERVKRYYEKSKYAKAERKRLDKLYRLTRINNTGPYHRWWIHESKKGCAKCGSVENLQIDHIIPRIDGGTDELKNLQVLCRKHNGEKGYGKKKTSPIWKK